MSLFGFLLVFLALPLLIGYPIGEKKNVSWRNLGLIMMAIGIAIIMLGIIGGK